MSTLRVNNVAEAGGAPVITSGVLDSGSLPAGSILQVVSTIVTTNVTTNSTTFVDATGYSATITPKFSNSRIIILFSMNGVHNGANDFFLKLLRDSTDIFEETKLAYYTNGAALCASINFEEAASSTSSRTYKVQVRTNTGTHTMANGSLILLEVAG